MAKILGKDGRIGKRGGKLVQQQECCCNCPFPCDSTEDCPNPFDRVTVACKNHCCTEAATCCCLKGEIRGSVTINGEEIQLSSKATCEFYGGVWIDSFVWVDGEYLSMCETVQNWSAVCPACCCSEGEAQPDIVTKPECEALNCGGTWWSQYNPDPWLGTGIIDGCESASCETNSPAFEPGACCVDGVPDPSAKCEAQCNVLGGTWFPNKLPQHPTLADAPPTNKVICGPASCCWAQAECYRVCHYCPPEDDLNGPLQLYQSIPVGTICDTPGQECPQFYSPPPQPGAIPNEGDLVEDLNQLRCGNIWQQIDCPINDPNHPEVESVPSTIRGRSCKGIQCEDGGNDQDNRAVFARCYEKNLTVSINYYWVTFSANQTCAQRNCEGNPLP